MWPAVAAWCFRAGIAAVAAVAAASFPSDCSVSAQVGANIAGHNLNSGSGTVTTAAGCAGLCCGTPRCAAYTFTSFYPYNSSGAAAGCRFGRPCCFLKSAAGTMGRLDNCTSGVKSPPPPVPPPPLPRGGGACRTPRDCFFGGRCGVVGTCICDPGFTGPHCWSLDLGQARPGSGYPTVPPAPTARPVLPTNSTFSWGGAVIADPGDAGGYHLYVAEYMEHCPMTYGTWSTQTQIRHAVGPGPDGPWDPRDVAVPDAAGNPVIARAPDGTYLLYFTNTRWGGATRNCSGSVAQWGPPIYCSSSGEQCGTGISLAYSSSLAGPWTVKYGVIGFRATNPGAPVFGPGGAMVMGYKTWAKGGRCIGVVSAPSWRAWPYDTFPTGGMDACVVLATDAEDPSNLWRSPRGELRLLYHDSGFGGVAGSSDGGRSWIHSNRSTAAYQYPVQYADGSVLQCTHREEPKVLLSETGAPVLLITQCTTPAEMPNTAPTKAFPAGEKQYATRTVMQPIRAQTP